MELRPILSAMLRNKTGVVLVGLQIALTLAVVANSVFIIMQRIEKIGRPSGMDSANMIFVESFGFGPTYNQRETIRLDLDAIRRMPGVIAASSINQVPLSSSGSASTYGATPKQKDVNVNANYYEVDEQGIAALGVKLAEGRPFNEQEVQYTENQSSSDFVPSVIVTRELAKDLFGDVPALGKRVYDGIGQSAVIVGVLEHMQGAWVDWDKLNNVIIQPRIHTGPVARYVVRVEPGRRDALIKDIETALTSSTVSRAVTWVRPHKYFTDKSYLADNRMMKFLSVIVGLMILITALGIVGLASFHVSVRTKQIGTRRAVGARRVDIIRYFMIENWLLTTGGVIAGVVLAFAFGQWLSSAYSLPRLQPIYVGAGILLLWILGQIAVLVPARRAAAIPPAIATRTV
jgi:putative ABC transport system permease protein